MPGPGVPRLRGWLHAVWFPLTVLAALFLVTIAPTTSGRVTAAIFGATACLLFGISALYHRGTWGPKAYGILKRFDHANIFLIIAGSYTPFALLLERRDAVVLLSIVWTGAIAGVIFRIAWVRAPRWLYVPIYVGLGWAALFWLPDFMRTGGGLVLGLIIAGGLLYSLGALFYGLKRPNISPGWFGSHELFHALTIVAFTTHYIAAAITIVRLG